MAIRLLSGSDTSARSNYLRIAGVIVAETRSFEGPGNHSASEDVLRRDAPS